MLRGFRSSSALFAAALGLSEARADATANRQAEQSATVSPDRLATTGDSTAATEKESIRIVYSASEGCPSEQEFTRQVLERTNNARLTTSDDSVRTFVVEIRTLDGPAQRNEAAGRKLQGSLLIRDPNGSSLARTFEGDHCSEVAMALALATALAIDPTAPFAPHDEPPDTPGETPDELNKPEAEPEPPSKSPVESERAVTTESEEVTTKERTPQMATRWELAFGPDFTGSIAPRGAFGGGVALQRRSAANATISSLALTSSVVFTSSRTIDGASSTFRALAFRPEICGHSLALSMVLQLAPCAGAELGAIQGLGRGLPVEGDDTRLWAALDLSARLRWDLSEFWFVHADAAFVFPLSRHRYYFQNPETTVNTVPAVSGSGRLRLGFSL